MIRLCIDIGATQLRVGVSTPAFSSTAAPRAGEPPAPESSTAWTTDNAGVLQLSSTYGAMVMVTARGVGTANLIATVGSEQITRKIEVIAP